ncbi:MAG: hypothetical protein OXF30_02525 [Candidatus Saccharibacteria bacterium]|nr:hypothetical protein [Candidatus Saccharibacteria bacterium]
MRKYRVEDLPAYFRQWQTNMRKDPYVRDGQAQACNRLAGRIIPYFMKDPSLWIECQIINEWDLSNCESVEEYLQAWHQSLRDSQQQTRLPGIISDLLGLDT